MLCIWCCVKSTSGRHTDIIHSWWAFHRSAVDRACVVPRLYSTYGDKSFTAAGPRVWNSLPSYLRRDSSYGLFKRKLKTFLFGAKWPQCIVTVFCFVYISILTYVLTFSGFVYGILLDRQTVCCWCRRRKETGLHPVRLRGPDVPLLLTHTEPFDKLFTAVVRVMHGSWYVAIGNYAHKKSNFVQYEIICEGFKTKHHQSASHGKKSWLRKYASEYTFYYMKPEAVKMSFKFKNQSKI